MDSDWCLFCEKHVQELDALYCSKECARKDKLMATSSKSTTRLSSSLASNITAIPQGNNIPSSFRRSASQSATMAFPGLSRSSSHSLGLVSSRRGVIKSSNISNSNGGSGKLNLFASSTAAAAMSIRGLPLNRSSTRRQPLVLYDSEEE
ncbi:hypothetical protein BGZ76_007529 [Entomortierella beljakovae]|nr:hypothetical protein BGZ76_007529 [Entomortierella beljakovae]